MSIPYSLLFQMFDEEDLDSEALLVQGDDGSSVPLDRLQVLILFHGYVEN